MNNPYASKLHRHPIDLPHIVVQQSGRIPCIPFYRYAGPINFADCALIRRCAVPANAVTHFKFSRLVAGHSNTT
jgi:hypothetical protein